MTEMLFASEIEEAQRAYNRRIMEERARTGCYDENGLYKVTSYKEGDVFLYLEFVDDSSIYVLRDGRIQTSRPSEGLYVTPLNMAGKWYDNGGEAWLDAKIKELKEVVTC